MPQTKPMKQESRHTDPETGERYVRVRIADYDAWKKQAKDKKRKKAVSTVR